MVVKSIRHSMSVPASTHTVFPKFSVKKGSKLIRLLFSMNQDMGGDGQAMHLYISEIKQAAQPSEVSAGVIAEYRSRQDGAASISIQPKVLELHGLTANVDKLYVGVYQSIATASAAVTLIFDE